MDAPTLKTLGQSSLEERQSAWLYRYVALVEPDKNRSDMFFRLAEEAEKQAQIWDNELKSRGAPPPAFRANLRMRVVAALVSILGPRAIRPILAAMKVRGLSSYDAPIKGHPMPTRIEDVGGRHRGVSAGGNLRAAVFGVNDGLVSNTSLIMGIAGATDDVNFILMSGVAGLLAGALSMAAGEYVSMRSQREMYEYQIGLEREELAEYPKEEAEELALIYHARGMALEPARQFAGKLLQDPRHALDTLAREELGLNPDDLGSPWGAALFSFTSFTAGALVPLAPFVLGLMNPVSLAALLAAVALFAVGAALSLFTGRRAITSGLRMVVIGGLAGAATYGIGALLGVSLG